MSHTEQPHEHSSRGALLLIGAVVIAYVLALLMGWPQAATEIIVGHQPGAAAHATPPPPEYTVVPCSTPHPQQIVGTVDMSVRSVNYTDYSAIAVFVAEVCERFVEYSLFVRDDITADDHRTQVLAIPSEKEFDGGTTDALCTISARDGSDLTESLYRPLP